MLRKEVKFWAKKNAVVLNADLAGACLWWIYGFYDCC